MACSTLIRVSRNSPSNVGPDRVAGMGRSGASFDKEQKVDIRAAGGLIWRVTKHSTEIVLVHRPRYDDWSFPKGKAEAGETGEQTALREVTEETGLDCVLGQEMPHVSYRDNKGRSKVVRYWAMTVRGGEFAPNDEVDRLAWMSIDRAGRKLTYDHDADVLRAFVKRILTK
jgi:8-oxo-dGTP pyrophosphatase MutT (NUDIX family)